MNNFFRISSVCIILILLSTFNLNAQNLDWAKNFKSSGTAYNTSIDYDQNGNVIVAGIFEGSTDMDPGPGTYNLTSNGGNDIVVAKYDKFGNILWAFHIGSSGSEACNDMVVDNAGNIYITGSFRNTADFDPSGNTYNLTSDGANDLYVAKFTGSGTLVWAFDIGGPLPGQDEFGNAIALDNSGNILITGEYEFTTDFDPGTGTSSITSNGYYDVFVAKYDNSGNFLWVYGFGDTQRDTGYDIEIDKYGNVITTGKFEGTIDIEPGAGTTNLTSSISSDIYLVKYAPNGSLDWGFNFDGTSGAVGYKVGTDVSANIYLSGIYWGTIDFDPGAGTSSFTAAGTHDLILASYDAGGSFRWASSFTGDNSSYPGEIILKGTDDLYFSGYFYGTLDFDPGPDTKNITAYGQSDIFFGKYGSSDGSFKWVRRIGNSNSSSNSSMQVDGSGFIYLTGYFRDTLDFDPGPRTIELTSVDIQDTYLAKYSDPVIPSLTGWASIALGSLLLIAGGWFVWKRIS